MKRLVIMLILVIVVGIFFYTTTPDVRTKVDNWIGLSKPDSVAKPLDSAAVPNRTRTQTTKRKQTPKTIRPDKYASLDKYARETPARYSRDNATLAKYLSQHAKNDIQKARLIYSWIATHIQYDDESFNTGEYKSQNADSVLVSRAAVCEGFSSLFQALGLAMGLKVEKVIGYAKGYGYHPGDKFLDTDHAWNVVKIEDTWQLVDVTWGSGYGKSTDKGLVSTQRFDPYWFCVKPEAFIFSHLPANDDWQLTRNVITLGQYEHLPFIDDAFFKMGFDPKAAFQEAIDGDLKDVVQTFAFNYPINAIGLPIDKKLVRHTEYVFSIESEYLEKVAIIDEGQWIYFSRDAHVFKIKYAPKGDKLEILVKVNLDDSYSSKIAEYDIIEEGNTTSAERVDDRLQEPI